MPRQRKRGSRGGVRLKKRAPEPRTTITYGGMSCGKTAAVKAQLERLKAEGVTAIEAAEPRQLTPEERRDQTPDTGKPRKRSASRD